MALPPVETLIIDSDQWEHVEKDPDAASGSRPCCDRLMMSARDTEVRKPYLSSTYSLSMFYSDYFTSL